MTKGNKKNTDQVIKKKGQTYNRGGRKKLNDGKKLKVVFSKLRKYGSRDTGNERRETNHVDRREQKAPRHRVRMKKTDTF